MRKKKKPKPNDNYISIGLTTQSGSWAGEIRGCARGTRLGNLRRARSMIVLVMLSAPSKRQKKPLLAFFLSPFLVPG